MGDQPSASTTSPNITLQPQHSYYTRSKAQHETPFVPVPRLDLFDPETELKEQEDEAAIQPSEVSQKSTFGQYEVPLDSESKSATKENVTQIAGTSNLFSGSKQFFDLPRSIPVELPPPNLQPGRKICQDFNKSYPSLWFATFELRLDCWGITSDRMRTDFLLGHLTDDSLLSVQDIIFARPTYALLKRRLLEQYEPTMSARVSELLNPQALGDRKPSELLIFLKASVARNDVSQHMLRELFISRMPENIRLSLCSMHNASLEQLATAADKMVDTLMGSSSREWPNQSGSSANDFSNKLTTLENKIEQLLQVKDHLALNSKTVNNREFASSSGQMQRQTSISMPRVPTQPNKSFRHANPQNQVCYYHRKFGNQVYKCAPPCTWHKHPTHSGNFRWPRP